MKNIVHTLAIIVSALVASSVQAKSPIDTSAVSKVIALKTTSTPMTGQVLQEQILATDTGGLAMLRGRFKNTDTLSHFYNQLDEQKWMTIEQCASALETLTPTFLELKHQLTELTRVVLDDVSVYGVIGVGNTAATASPSAIVLGMEMVCNETPDTDAAKHILENYLAHELVHVVQYRVTKRTDFRFNLLEIALLEGSADLVAHSLLGDHYVLDDERNHFGENSTAALIEQFAPHRQSFDYQPWLYTQTSDMPMDMGYWIGFKLAEAFLNNGGTLAELLLLEDAEAIYQKANL